MPNVWELGVAKSRKGSDSKVFGIWTSRSFLDAEAELANRRRRNEMASSMMDSFLESVTPILNNLETPVIGPWLPTPADLCPLYIVSPRMPRGWRVWGYWNGEKDICGSIRVSRLWGC